MTVMSAIQAAPAIMGRNAVSYLRSAAWRADAKAAGVAALKVATRTDDPLALAAAATDVTELLRRVLGEPAHTVTCVPCGHSCREDCFGARLAAEVAAEWGAPFVKLWRDRPIKGVSHPKEFSRLPPLDWAAEPAGPVVVVDDLATSGWHMEEALTALRSRNVPCTGIVWIAGARARP
jgi:hypothetical protein